MKSALNNVDNAAAGSTDDLLDEDFEEMEGDEGMENSLDVNGIENQLSIDILSYLKGLI